MSMKNLFIIFLLSICSIHLFSNDKNINLDELYNACIKEQNIQNTNKTYLACVKLYQEYFKEDDFLIDTTNDTEQTIKSTINNLIITDTSNLTIKDKFDTLIYLIRHKQQYSLYEYDDINTIYRNLAEKFFNENCKESDSYFKYNECKNFYNIAKCNNKKYD